MAKEKLKVLHVIPAAFEYFDDIKSFAFDIVDALNERGIFAEAFTLQYDAPDKKVRNETDDSSPVSKYRGSVSLSEGLGSWSQYDIIHMHCPFLGGAGKILEWRMKNPEKIFITTFHRRVNFSDLISLFIKAYNHYYLRKIFNTSNVVALLSVNQIVFRSAKEYLRDHEKLIFLRNSKDGYPQLEEVADNLILLYTKLVSN